MLLEWLRWPRRSHHRKPAAPKQFSCSSFRDIQDVLNENDTVSEPDSPKSPSIFHRFRGSSLRWTHRATVCPSPESQKPPSSLSSPDHHHRGVVLYFTTLRVVRRTFEDCRAVRSILRGLRVPIDERDLSMDAKFVDDLKSIFGQKHVSLPRVFIGGRYFGGADEIRKMSESGELKKLICELPPSDEMAGAMCAVCGGLRFVVCKRCNGSHKIFSEKIGFTMCTACNEYGLIRCPACCPGHRLGWKNK